MNLSLFSRNSFQYIKWWFELDHIIFFITFILLIFGLLVLTSASPSVAHKIGVDSNFFYKKHIVFLILGLFVILFISALNERIIAKISLFMLIFCLLLMILVLLNEPQLKGAKRWIRFFGFSLQPSEFIKPAFIIVNALLLSKFVQNEKSQNFILASFILYIIIISLLILQPDMGMVINFTLIWLAQLFIIGFPFKILFIIASIGFLGIMAAYFIFAHVKYRIDMFLFSDGNVSYQVQKSLDAISNGGLFGQGYFNGEIKNNLPDSHTDFIFAVIVEEFGFIISAILLILYGAIILRSLNKAFKHENLFVSIALTGLCLQIAFQVLVNIGVGINYLPTKGTTLPLISYGGSSFIATSIIMGSILLFTKRKFGMVIYANR